MKEHYKIHFKWTDENITIEEEQTSHYYPTGINNVEYIDQNVTIKCTSGEHPPNFKKIQKMYIPMKEKKHFRTDWWGHRWATVLTDEGYGVIGDLLDRIETELTRKTDYTSYSEEI